MKRLGTTVVAFLLGIILAGGHVAMLQTIAWASMIAARTASDSFSTAFASTFDGKHPCGICQAISQQLAQQKADGDGKRAPEPSGKKLKLDCLVEIRWQAPLERVVVRVLDRSDPVLIARADDAPPVRPPARS